MHFLNKVFTFLLLTQTRQSVAENEKMEFQNETLDSVEENIKSISLNNKEGETLYTIWMYDIESEYEDYFKMKDYGCPEYNPKFTLQIKEDKKKYFSFEVFSELKILWAAVALEVEMQTRKIQSRSKIDDDSGLTRKHLQDCTVENIDKITVDMIFVYKLIMNTTSMEDILYLEGDKTNITEFNNGLMVEFKRNFLRKHLMILELIYENWQNRVEEFFTGLIFKLKECVKNELEKIPKTIPEGMPNFLISW